MTAEEKRPKVRRQVSGDSGQEPIFSGGAGLLLSQGGNQLEHLRFLHAEGTTMIIKEFYSTRDDGVKLYHIYSDKGVKIQQEPTGNLYEDVIDIENAHYTYIETEYPAEIEMNREDAFEALNILLGLNQEDDINDYND